MIDRLTSHRVSDRLAAARRRRFVGRAAELELLRSALADPTPPFAVLFVHGPAGVGKSTLLTAMADAAAQAGVASLRLDLRDVEPSPPAFAAALGLRAGERTTSALGDGGRFVLLLDTFEQAAPLEGWLRERFLPELPGDALVVIAGRNPPGPQWAADPAWRELTRVVSLRNLPRPDVLEYVARAGLGEDVAEHVADVTYGHPLALALVADVIAQRAAEPGTDDVRRLGLADAPDVVGALVARFVDDVPGEQHRRALEVCAQARVTTEDLLRAVIDPARAAELFAWLRSLSFVEEGPGGLSPHDLARDVLAADLRWRDPATFAALHKGVHDHAVRRIEECEGTEQQRIADLVFLHRANPFTAAYWDWASFGQAYADTLRPGDREALLAMARRHEGEESAALVAYWLERQPHAFVVFRGARERAIGFAALLALHEASADDLAADPGAASMWAYAQRTAPTRPGEAVLGGRFYMDEQAYQGPSPSFNVITVAHTQHILGRPRRGWDLLGPWTDADQVAPIMSYIEFERVPEADYEIGGRRYGVFAHDWRRMDVATWLDVMGARERATGFSAPPPAAAAPVVALSQEAFAEAVRRSLRDLHRPDGLATNPLMRSRVIADRAGGEATPSDLCAAIEEAVASLAADPRDAKLERALARTYLRPAPTQEAAAEVLGLPFSTYRRHLTRGVERVIEWLWQRELYGPER